MRQTCPTCAQSFINKRDLVNHERQKHGNFKCFLCSDVESNSTALLQHVRENHGGRLEFVRIQNVMRASSETWRYEILGVQSNVASTLNQMMVREIIAFLNQRLVNHPSFNTSITLTAMFKKANPGGSDENLHTQSFQSESFIASRATTSITRQRVIGSLQYFEQSVDSLALEGSGLVLED